VRLPCSTTLVIKNTKKKLYSLSASPFDLGITTKLAWLLMSKEKKLSKGLRDIKKKQFKKTSSFMIFLLSHAQKIVTKNIPSIRYPRKNE